MPQVGTQRDGGKCRKGDLTLISIPPSEVLNKTQWAVSMNALKKYLTSIQEAKYMTPCSCQATSAESRVGLIATISSMKNSPILLFAESLAGALSPRGSGFFFFQPGVKES